MAGTDPIQTFRPSSFRQQVSEQSSYSSRWLTANFSAFSVGQPVVNRRQNCIESSLATLTDPELQMPVRKIRFERSWHVIVRDP